MVKKYNLKAATLSLAFAGLLAAPLVSQAGTEMSSGKESKNMVEEAKKSCISGDLGVTFVSEYISRGLVLEKKGFIAQPYLDLYFKLYEGTGFINSVTFNLGFWSSIQQNKDTAGSGSTTPNWYEFDYTPGITVAFAKNFTLTVSYFEFDSPSDAFQTARSINTVLAYNDNDLLGAFALHPHVTVNKTIDGFVGLEKNAWYFEVGVAPSYTFFKGSTYPVTFTVPMNAGFGDDKFYAGDHFGFFSAGATLAVPLAFIPTCYGTWSVTGGETYYRLGTNVADATAAGQRDRYVGSLAVGMTF